MLFGVIDGFVDGESLINSLYCDATIHISSQLSNNTIILKDLEYRDDKNGYIYESVYIKDDGITKKFRIIKKTLIRHENEHCFIIFLLFLGCRF